MKYLSIAISPILMLGSYANLKRRAWDNDLKVKVFNSTSNSGVKVVNLVVFKEYLIQKYSNVNENSLK